MDTVHEQTIILSSSTANKEACQFEIVFQKPLILEQPSEIGLVEVSLAKSVKTYKFLTPKSMNLCLSWIEDFFATKNYATNAFLGTYQSNQQYDDSVVLTEEIIIPKEIYDLQQLIVYFRNLVYVDIIQKLFIIRMDGYDLEQWARHLKIFPPKIEYVTNKFNNFPGRIEAFDRNDNTWKFLAHLYINFDYELHSILGFDVNSFPCFTKDYFKGHVTLSNKAKPIEAPFACTDLGLIDVFYLYTDVVQETYIGNMKVNVLRVFPRQESTEDIIHYSFHNLIYIPLRVQEINSIKFEICDSLGQIAHYDKGEIVFVIIIRPIENR